MGAPLDEAAPYLEQEERVSESLHLNGASRVAVSIFVFFAVTGVAYAAYRIVSHEIPRTHTEKRLNVHVYAPYGSLAIAPGTSDADIAKLDVEADESGDDPAMYLRYGVSQSGIGSLRVSIGDDEGAIPQRPPVAMWRARTQRTFLSTNYILNDNGGGYSFGYDPDNAASIPTPGPGTQKEGDYKSRLYLAKDLPTTLNAQLGFGESFIDLTGMPMERAYIETGASKVRVVFGAPNPIPMSLYQISAGVGECALDGICY